MFYATYVLSELRRRKGRTLLTALGLAVGVGLVVTVSALSKGLDNAQSKVLEPLTGVGTDMSVSRPLKVSGSGNSQTFGPGGGPRLSPNEQKQLRDENGGARLGLRNVAKPGERFSRDDFISTSQLSFSESEVAKIAALDGVQQASGALTLSSVHVSGRVPKDAGSNSGPRVFAQPGPAAGAGSAGPKAINFDARTVTGVDVSKQAALGGQITKGRYLASSGKKYDAVLNESYAKRKGLSVGDTFTLSGKKFTIVGLMSAPIGGQASDIYMRLDVLQKLSGREGRVNTVQVRAASTDAVGRVKSEIQRTFAGAEVTTAKDLADRVGGSLVDAKNLSNKLGTALEVVGLAAAFLIASLLTLSSVAKRTRELGTLKALGWRQRLVVRQVTGEALAQGALGGIVGVLLGICGAALLNAFGPTLKATVAAAQPSGPGPLPFGQGQVTSGSTTVALHAPVDAGLILLAVALALLGGLLAGSVGGLRAARLRPAEALRSVE
ncbi:MAG TPA: ABC transporter permease [Thermoleophilaceae bacterium]